MNPEENNQNISRADSFEDLRRQLRLDDDENDGVSLYDELMNGGKCKVALYHSEDPWYGVTYAEDKAFVKESIASLMKSGRYPEKLS